MCVLHVVLPKCPCLDQYSICRYHEHYKIYKFHTMVRVLYIMKLLYSATVSIAEDAITCLCPLYYTYILFVDIDVHVYE